MRLRFYFLYENAMGHSSYEDIMNAWLISYGLLDATYIIRGALIIYFMCA